MARVTLSLLLLLSILYLAVGATDFIKASCSATRYPTLCIQSLSPYASQIQQSPKKLAQVALSVSLARAKSAKAFVSNMTKIKGMKSREYQEVKDCVDEMGDSVDQLSRSVSEMGQMGKDFKWDMSNVQTWVSAALTDETTCVDGFGGRAMDDNVKASIRGRVVNLAQVTSNALALVNRFAARHRAAAMAGKT